MASSILRQEKSGPGRRGEKKTAALSRTGPILRESGIERRSSGVQISGRRTAIKSRGRTLEGGRLRAGLKEAGRESEGGQQ